MLHCSIKIRVTLWYTSFVAVILVCVCAVMYLYSGYITDTATQKILVSAAERAAVQIVRSDGSLTIPPSLEELQDTEEVDLLIYSQDGTLLYGQNPYVTDEMTLSAGTVRKYRLDGKQLYLYDVQADGFWVRCVDSYGSAQITAHSMLRITLLCIPLVLLIAGSGGWHITKRAFSPVEQMTQAADQIMTAGDLDKRLAAHYSSKDEIGRLAMTFDRMLARIGRSFQMEQEFTSNASHELRTPVASILSQCEYLETLTEGEAALCVRNIRTSAKRMSELIASLLMLTRAETNRLRLCCEPLDLSEMIGMLTEELAARAAERGILLVTEAAPGIRIRGDQTLILQMLINLLSNALKYTDQGGTITVTADVHEHVIVSIRDNGCGIPEEHLEQIWQRFYREDAARNSSIPGYGLGLPIAKWIAEAHGGRIRVRSRVGVGTMFYVELPAMQEETAAEQ